MREIKFRAWIRSYSDGPFKMMPKENLKTEAVYLSWDMEVKPGIGYEDAVIMQYTGLKDKNGKEIYEGDVVRCKNYIPSVCTVDWLDGSVGFAPFTDPEFDWDANSVPRPENCEVIGNIYENPDLC